MFQKKTTSFEDEEKKSVFVCFLHFLELEGQLAFDELS